MSVTGGKLTGACVASPRCQYFLFKESISQSNYTAVDGMTLFG